MTAHTMVGLLLASSEDGETPTETSARPTAPMPGEKATLEELNDGDVPI